MSTPAAAPAAAPEWAVYVRAPRASETTRLDPYASYRRYTALFARVVECGEGGNLGPSRVGIGKTVLVPGPTGRNQCAEVMAEACTYDPKTH